MAPHSMFQEYWESYFTNVPDKPVLWVGTGSSCVFHSTTLLIALISSRFVGDYTWSLGASTILATHPFSSSPVSNAQHT